MQKIIPVYKPVGKTPLDMIKKLRIKIPELRDVKIGYAGRLDPLAHGVLVLMIGDETKKRDAYLNLDKQYEFEAVFGIATDTYDLLGLTNKTVTKNPPENVNIIVNNFVNKHIGKQRQFYPPFSSKTVDGKPLFWWTKSGKLHEIEIPAREIEIFEFWIIATGEISSSALQQKVKKEIGVVHGDFRQKRIEENWEHFFTLTKFKSFKTVKFFIRCSSGTYVRELIHQLGKEAGCGAVAIDIFRVAVGEYTLNKAVKF